MLKEKGLENKSTLMVESVEVAILSRGCAWVQKVLFGQTYVVCYGRIRRGGNGACFPDLEE